MMLSHGRAPRTTWWPQPAAGGSSRRAAGAQVRGRRAAKSGLKAHKHHSGLRAARVALFIVGSCAAASAKDARTSLAVSATVNAVARFDLRSAPAAVRVSQADLGRGFIDIGEPLLLVVHSNSREGFALDLAPLAPLFSSLTVEGLDAPQILGPDGGTIVQRWRAPHEVNLSLRLRLGLAPGLAAGTYPWPLRVSVRPLESL